MQFSIDRSDFAEILGRVVPVVSKKSTSPIYESILIEVGAGTINLTGSSDSAQVTASVGTLDATDGAFAVHAHTLSAIVKKLPSNGKPIAVEAKDGHLIIKSGRSRFKLPTLPASDYPSFEGSGDVVGSAKVGAGKLYAILVASSVAMGKDETRYYLMGVNVRQRGSYCVFCSTDGHRLTRKEADIDFGGDIEAILPRTSVEYLISTFGTDGDVDVSFGANVATFEKGDLVYRTKLYDAQFPDYERIIPSGGEVVFHGSREDFITALDVVSPVQEAITRGVKLAAVDGGLQVAASADANNTGATEIDGSTPSFEKVAASKGYIGVNGDYLASILKAMEADEIQLLSEREMSPLKIVGDSGFTAVVMPLRV